VTTMAAGHTDSPVTLHDANTERVLEFALKMFEAGSVARIAEAVIDIAVSGAWRDYDIDGHRSHWQAAEFDYFLITCGVKYTDMEAVLKGCASAALLAPFMDQRDQQHRKLPEASQAWGSPRPGVTLISLAREHGWVTDRGRARRPPMGRRSRARAAGASREERAREARRRRIGPARCAVLEEVAAELAQNLTVDEIRFLADELLHQ
jgi:hypothetical protein